MEKATHSTKLFFLLLYIIAVFSCLSTPRTKSSSQASFPDTSSFPKTAFSAVTLFCLDSSYETTINTDSGRYINKAIFEYVGGAGYSFIDKQGEPKTKNYTSYKLNSSQITQLEKFLSQRTMRR